MLRKLECAVVGLVIFGAGCTQDVVRDAAKPPPSCKAEVNNIQRSFRPLPAGLEYGRLSKKWLAEERRDTADIAIAFDARIVKGMGAVTVTVFKTQFGPADEEGFKRGLAQEAGMPGEKWEDVRFGSATVTYVRSDQRGYYARIYSGCRAVLVVGPEGDTLRQVARAVLG
jgi:hypothetical protein